MTTKRIHLVAGLLSAVCIATFFTSTITVEWFGSHAAVAQLKRLIVMPGLLLLVPAMALTGWSGFRLARGMQNSIAATKRRRMPVIGANGVLVLLPCALVLDRWAGSGTFDRAFYGVQALELLSGALNLTLMGLNIRDGMRLRGRLLSPRAAGGHVHLG